MCMKSEVTLSTLWKTRELRHVAMLSDGSQLAEVPWC